MADYLAPLSEDDAKAQAWGAANGWEAKNSRAFDEQSYGPVSNGWFSTLEQRPYPQFSGAFGPAVQLPVMAQRNADFGALTAGLFEVRNMTVPFPAAQAQAYLDALRDAFSVERMPTLPEQVRSYIVNDLQWDLMRGLWVKLYPVRGARGDLPAWLSGVEGEAAKATWDAAFAAIDGPTATLLEITGKRAAATVAAAQADADSASAMLRLAQGVATLGMSELMPILRAKWIAFKQVFADYDATAREIEAKLADPAYTEESKAAVRAQYEAQHGSVMSALTGHGDFTFAGASVPLPDINQWLNGEGLPADLQGLGILPMLGSLSTPVLIAAIVAITAIVAMALLALKPLLDQLARVVGVVADAGGKVVSALGGGGLVVVGVGVLAIVAWKKGWLKQLGIGK